MSGQGSNLWSRHSVSNGESGRDSVLVALTTTGSSDLHDRPWSEGLSWLPQAARTKAQSSSAMNERVLHIGMCLSMG